MDFGIEEIIWWDLLVHLALEIGFCGVGDLVNPRLVASRKRQWKLQVWDLLWFQPECRCSNIALTSAVLVNFSVAQNDDGDFFFERL